MEQSRRIITVRACTEADIDKLGPVEISAAQPFTQFPALADLSNDSTAPATLRELLERMNRWNAGERDGLWSWIHVACAGGEIVGFLAATQLDSSAHIEELSVAATRQKYGAGTLLMRQLIESVTAAVTASEQPRGRRLDGSLSLRTFVDVPWNKPWYEKFGFEEVDPVVAGEGHLQKSNDDPAEREGWRRCLMMKR